MTKKDGNKLERIAKAWKELEEKGYNREDIYATIESSVHKLKMGLEPSYDIVDYYESIKEKLTCLSSGVSNKNKEIIDRKREQYNSFLYQSEPLWKQVTNQGEEHKMPFESTDELQKMVQVIAETIIKDNDSLSAGDVAKQLELAIVSDAVLFYVFEKEMSKASCMHLTDDLICTPEAKDKSKWILDLQEKLLEKRSVRKIEEEIWRPKVIEMIGSILSDDLEERLLAPTIVFCAAVSPSLAYNGIAGNADITYDRVVLDVATDRFLAEYKSKTQNDFSKSVKIKIAKAYDSGKGTASIVNSVKLFLKIIACTNDVISSANELPSKQNCIRIGRNSETTSSRKTDINGKVIVAFREVFSLFAINRVTSVLELFFAAKSDCTYPWSLPEMFFSKMLPICSDDSEAASLNVMVMIRKAVVELAELLFEINRTEGVTIRDIYDMLSDKEYATLFCTTAEQLNRELSALETFDLKFSHYTPDREKGKVVMVKREECETRDCHIHFDNYFELIARQTLQVQW